MAKSYTGRHQRRPLLRLLTLAILLAAAVLFFRWSNTSVQLTQTEVILDRLPAGFDGCHIAVLGDLHSTEFGENNQSLLTLLTEQAPEHIVLVGDLLDSYRDVPPGYAAETAAALTAIAPTYYVTGNHEWAIGDVPALKETLSAAGVTVLSNEFLTLEQNGDSIVLAGIDDPNGYADQKTPEELAAELRAAHEDAFWILLAHRNDRFAPQYSRLGADLVLSGHGHGGLVRLPFTDGLISTEHTLFPSYTAGLYEENDSTLFVTRGLGNSGPSFRLFNRPEAAILTLRKG